MEKSRHRESLYLPNSSLLICEKLGPRWLTGGVLCFVESPPAVQVSLAADVTWSANHPSI